MSLEEPQCAWRQDAGGDWHLSADGHYDGMGCPHHLGSHTILIDGAINTYMPALLADAQRSRERAVRADRAAAQPWHAVMHGDSAVPEA